MNIIVLTIERLQGKRQIQGYENLEFSTIY